MIPFVRLTCQHPTTDSQDVTKNTKSVNATLRIMAIEIQRAEDVASPKGNTGLRVLRVPNSCLYGLIDLHCALCYIFSANLVVEPSLILGGITNEESSFICVVPRACSGRVCLVVKGSRGALASPFRHKVVSAMIAV